MPLVLMELKSPSKDEVGVENAYKQIRNYIKDIPSLFYYNAICVISDLSSNKAGTITSGLDRFMDWKCKDGSKEESGFAEFETFYEGMFQKKRLLDILKNFILFSGMGTGRFKVLAGYHQYFAVRKAIERAKIATRTDGKGGVFWHTQGSGKSLSMVFYAHLLQEALHSPTSQRTKHHPEPRPGQGGHHKQGSSHDTRKTGKPHHHTGDSRPAGNGIFQLSQTVQGVHGHLAGSLPTGAASAEGSRTALIYADKHQRDSLQAELRFARLFLKQVQGESGMQTKRIQRKDGIKIRIC